MAILTDLFWDELVLGLSVGVRGKSGIASDWSTLLWLRRSVPSCAAPRPSGTERETKAAAALHVGDDAGGQARNPQDTQSCKRGRRATVARGPP